MASTRNRENWDAPQRHPDHKRPVTRREFVAQGFMSGSAFALSGGVFSLFANPREAFGALSGDLQPLLANPCDIATVGAGKIPFICFDLAGGANIAGSNVLVGQEGGQMDFLGTSGYEKLGLPGDMVPGLNDPVSGLPYANTDFGLAFHSDSPFKRGMELSMSPGRAANLNGAIIPARSDNDTGNNPHNPLYGIARAGADGSILTLAGTENTDSGGNSMIPAMMMNPELRPTKVDRPGDVTGLVDTGQLVGILGPDDATAVMESIYRITDRKMGVVDAGQQVQAGDVIKDMVKCGYLKAADIADRFGDTPLDPALDPAIVGPNGIFTEAEFNDNGRDGQEFRKTASMMKLVINGFAGAGCIEMGGYDYHGGRRAEGEVKARRALHGCLHRVRGAHRRAAHDVRLQRRLAVLERRDRQLAGRPRQGRMGERQLLDRRLLLHGLQPLWPGDAARRDRRRAGVAPAARLHGCRRLGAARGDAGGQQRQPAREHGHPQLHGPARRGRQLRQPVPEPRSRRQLAARRDDRVRRDRQRDDRAPEPCLSLPSPQGVCVSLEPVVGDAPPPASFCPGEESP